MNLTISSHTEGKGIIGRANENGFPVIYKFVNAIPSSVVCKHLSCLTVISWKYDGDSNNGMPEPHENQRMINLEDTIKNSIENDELLRHVYSRTGNNLKELVYYIHNQNQFLEAFNEVMSYQPKYPIEIDFYEDKDWEDFQKLINDFT